MKNGVTIIIPTRNEEGVIIKTLDVLRKEVKVPYEVIVIDGCSTDNTKERVTSYSKNENRIRIISQKFENRGFAIAFAQGVENSRGKFIVFVMADLCDNPATINQMYKKINKGWDIVCGSRYTKGAKKSGGPKLQGIFSYIVCRTLHSLIGIPTQDVSNAFKMYRKEVLKKLSFNSESGMEISMDLALQAYFMGAKMTDIPTAWIGRTVGESKFKMLERMPRYVRIYIWALKNHVRSLLGFKYKAVS